MLTSHSHDDEDNECLCARHPRNWTVQHIDNQIVGQRISAKAWHGASWEETRTRCSAIVGLKVVRNLKLGKAWNDGFKKR